MKDILLKVTIVLIALFAIYSLYKNHSQARLFPNYETKTVVIGEAKYKLYVADTDDKRNKGLSGVKKLAGNEGMLFVFPQKGRYQFWMKEMNFDLDFIFLDGDNVVDVIEDVQLNSYPKIYQGEELYDKVIELPADNHIDVVSTIKI